MGAVPRYNFWQDIQDVASGTRRDPRLRPAGVQTATPYAGYTGTPVKPASKTSGAPLPAMPDGTAGAPPTGAELASQDPNQRILKMLEDFFAELNKPFDPNDPAVQQVLGQMRMDATQNATNRGIFGPYSENLAQQAYGRGANQLALQKKGMAGQALGALTGARFNQRDFDYQRSQDQYANQMDLWKFNQGQNAGLGGLIGGGLGALAGSGAGPAGVAAGWQIGSGLGQGAAGFFGGQPPRFTGGF